MADAKVKQRNVIKLELKLVEAGLICDALQNPFSDFDEADSYRQRREHIYTVLRTALNEGFALAKNEG